MRVADKWFQRRTYEDGVTLLVEPYVHPIIRCNVWHVRGRDRDLVVDTGVGVASVVAEMSDLLERPVVCVATHVHFDHVGCFHEFAERLIHPVAAPQMDPYQGSLPLRWSSADEGLVEGVVAAGYVIDGDELLTALPCADFDIDAFRTQGVKPTGTVDEGDIIDLGDRHFDVLHLPGHTPCSIGLWEERTKTLFSGDAIYDGPLLDALPESDIKSYVATMKRLRDTPARTVHAGHDESFAADRLVELADQYLATRA